MSGYPWQQYYDQCVSYAWGTDSECMSYGRCVSDGMDSAVNVCTSGDYGTFNCNNTLGVAMLETACRNSTIGTTPPSDDPPGDDDGSGGFSIPTRPVLRPPDVPPVNYNNNCFIRDLIRRRRHDQCGRRSPIEHTLVGSQRGSGYFSSCVLI